MPKFNIFTKISTYAISPVEAATKADAMRLMNETLNAKTLKFHFVLTVKNCKIIKVEEVTTKDENQDA